MSAKQKWGMSVDGELAMALHRNVLQQLERLRPSRGSYGMRPAPIDVNVLLYCFREKVGGLEKHAREARKGLWADQHPVPPWEWRKRESR
jgi:hypothetical protein